MEVPRSVSIYSPVLLPTEHTAVLIQPWAKPTLSSTFKVINTIRKISNLDGTSDAETETPDSHKHRRSSTLPSSNSPPRFWQSTKASRARQEAAKARRKSTDTDRNTTTFQIHKKSTDTEEAPMATPRSARMNALSAPLDTQELYVVLQFDDMFPHCKAHGVFLDIVDANNKVIQLYKEDESTRQDRGKVTPYISEHGCLQYYRTKTDPKSMVWVTRIPIYSGEGPLMPWPNEEEGKVLWTSSGPERRAAAGWK